MVQLISQSINQQSFVQRTSDLSCGLPLMQLLKVGYKFKPLEICNFGNNQKFLYWHLYLLEQFFADKLHLTDDQLLTIPHIA